MKEKLAIDGGKPAKKKKFKYWYPGARLYGSEERKEVLEVLKSKSTFRYYGINKPTKVDRFEKEFAKKIGVKYALAVTSGTAALVVALQAAGIGYGDEVIVPSSTFIATAGSVVMVGGIPVFAEIDKSISIDPSDIERHITKKTKAIIPVHWQGVPCQMDKIMKIAAEYNLTVIEDCAQSCGASYKSKKIGSIGHIGAFSLQYNKIITTGDGGVVTTNDPVLYERLIRCHDHGGVRKNHGIPATMEDYFGMCFRMNELTAAVGLAQLRKLNAKIIKPMRKAAGIINKTLESLKPLGIEPRCLNDTNGHIGSTVGFFVKDKTDAIKWVKALVAENIDLTGTNFYTGGIHKDIRFIHRNSYHKSGFPFNLTKRKYKENDCPKTTKLLGRLVRIALPPNINEKETQEIARAIEKVASVYCFKGAR